MAISVPLYTVDDLDKFPDDGNRYELLDGVLLVTPAPAAVHQIVVSRIQARLAPALQDPGHAHVVGPGAVVRKPRTQLQPDIVAYFALGVEQVWLVDWRERLVEVCKAIGKSRRVRDVIRWRATHVDVTVTIDLAEVFAGL